MRIDEPIEQPGFFWLPGQDDEKVAGGLRIGQSGRINLDLFGALDGDQNDPSRTILNPSHRPSFQRPDRFARIHGLIEGKEVTLDDCISESSDWRLAGGVSKSTLSARRAYVGAWYESDEVATFARIAVSIEGLHEWLLISGLKGEQDYSNGRIGKLTHTFEPPTGITVSLADGTELAFDLSWSDSGIGPDTTEAKFTQLAHMIVRNSLPATLDDKLVTVFTFQRLLSLAVDRPVELRSITGYSPELVRNDRELPVQIYVPGNDSLVAGRRIHWSRMVFTYPEIADRFQELISEWYEQYEAVGPAINLYDGLVSGGYRYVEGRLLATIQAAEAFHRRALPQQPQMTDEQFLMIRQSLPESIPSVIRSRVNSLVALAKEQSLRQRLEDMMAPFQHLFGEEPERLVKEFVDTRNRLAHTAAANEGSDDDPIAIFQLQQRLEALIQLHLLKLIGFGDEEIDKIASKQEISRKLP